MAEVPAICETCGAVFSSGWEVENPHNVVFQGKGYAPCPVCEGRGEIVQGVYDLVGETVQVIATGEYSEAQLKRLRAVVVQAQESGASHAEFVQTLEREAPELANAAKRFSAVTRAEVIALLTLLFMVLDTFAFRPAAADLSVRDINRLAEQVIERTMDACGAAPPSTQPKAPPAEPKAPARKRPPESPRKQQKSKAKKKKPRG